MKKLLVGTAAAAVLLAGGAYVAKQWMQQRALAEVEETFRSLGKGFAKVEHGPVEFDAWNRTLTISNIALQPVNGPADAVTKIARLTAHGVGGQNGSVAVDRLEIRDLESSGPAIADTTGAARAKYEAASITLRGFDMRPLEQPPAASGFGWAIGILEAVSAQSVDIPQLKNTTTIAAPAKAAPNLRPGALGMSGTVEQTQYNTRIENLAGGRLGKMTVERVSSTTRIGQSGAAEFTAEIKDTVVTDYDIAAILSALDPELAAKKPAGMTPLWRAGSVGAMSIKAGPGIVFTIGGASFDGFDMDLPKVAKAVRIFQANQPGIAVATPQQGAATVNAVVDIYESFKSGRFAITDLAVDIPGMEPARIGAIRVEDFNAGSLGNFVLTGLDATLPQQQKIRVGHFALRGFKVSHLLRMSAQLASGTGMARQTELMSEILRSLEAIELDDMTSPSKTAGQPIVIETLRASWGTFVGRTPVDWKIKIKANGPIGTTDPEPFASLARAGQGRVSLGFDGAWHWQEAEQTYVAGPFRLDVADALSATGQFTVGNVSRQALAAGPEMFADTASNFQLGPIEITIRDLGLSKIAARDPSLNAQWQQMTQDLRAAADAMSVDKPDAGAMIGGLLKFMTTPGSQLTAKLAPKSMTTVGDMRAAGMTGPALVGFLADRMTIAVSVTPGP
jgi:hypothetical protein